MHEELGGVGYRMLHTGSIGRCGLQDVTCRKHWEVWATECYLQEALGGVAYSMLHAGSTWRCRLQDVTCRKHYEVWATECYVKEALGGASYRMLCAGSTWRCRLQDVTREWMLCEEDKDDIIKTDDSAKQLKDMREFRRFCKKKVT